MSPSTVFLSGSALHRPRTVLQLLRRLAAFHPSLRTPGYHITTSLASFHEHIHNFAPPISVSHHPVVCIVSLITNPRCGSGRRNVIKNTRCKSFISTSDRLDPPYPTPKLDMDKQKMGTPRKDHPTRAPYKDSLRAPVPGFPPCPPRLVVKW